MLEADKHIPSQESEADIRKDIKAKAPQIQVLLKQALSTTGSLKQKYERIALLEIIRNSLSNLIRELENATKLKDGEVV